MVNLWNNVFGPQIMSSNSISIFKTEFLRVSYEVNICEPSWLYCFTMKIYIYIYNAAVHGWKMAKWLLFFESQTSPENQMLGDLVIH